MRFWEARSARRGGELMRVDMLLVDVNVSSNFFFFFGVRTMIDHSDGFILLIDSNIYIQFVFQSTMIQARINAPRLSKLTWFHVFITAGLPTHPC